MVRARFLGMVLLGTRGVLGQQAESCAQSIRPRQVGTSPSPLAHVGWEHAEGYPEVKGEVVGVATVGESNHILAFLCRCDLHLP